MTTKLAGYELGHVYLKGGSIKYKVIGMVDNDSEDWSITSLFENGREVTNRCPRWNDIELPKECFDNCQDGRTNCYNCEKRYWYLKTKEECI